MIIAPIARLHRYHGITPALDAAIDWVQDQAWPGLVDGRHDLGGDRFYVSVSRYDSKPLAETRWETHRKFIDIQILMSGLEAIDVCDPVDLSMSEAYDPERDIVFYHDPISPTATISRVVLRPNTAAIFFPEDAHRPCIALGKGAVVRKMVVKAASG